MRGRTDPYSGLPLVHRVEDGMDRRAIAGTTYQMRNFYRQLGDGFYSHLDVMNAIQHAQVVRWCRPGLHLLDVCCGRGLLLPLLRYGAPRLGSYTGVDIAPENAVWQQQRVTDGKPIDAATYYPFPVHFVESNAAVMAAALPAGRRYGLVVYTSALEHMHRDAGAASLVQARAVAEPGGLLFLTTPRTEEGRDGFQTQYRAHIYEWTRSELLAGLAGAGWQVQAEYGLLIGKRALLAAAEPLGLRPAIERLAEFVPADWLTPVLAPLFPQQATEIAFLAKAV